jgi:hypothetical protein
MNLRRIEVGEPALAKTQNPVACCSNRLGHVCFEPSSGSVGTRGYMHWV